MNKTCKHCGTPMVMKEWDGEKRFNKRKFCKRACVLAYQREHKTGFYERFSVKV